MILREAFREALKVPVGFDTDVNGAVLAARGTLRRGRGVVRMRSVSPLVQGVGVGAYTNGQSAAWPDASPRADISPAQAPGGYL